MPEIIMRSAEALFQQLNDGLSRNPWTGILASISGFATSLVSILQMASVAIGLIGAVFGCAAGYYTYRIQKRKFERCDNPDCQRGKPR